MTAAPPHRRTATARALAAILWLAAAPSPTAAFAAEPVRSLQL